MFSYKDQKDTAITDLGFWHNEEDQWNCLVIEVLHEKSTSERKIIFPEEDINLTRDSNKSIQILDQTTRMTILIN